MLKLYTYFRSSAAYRVRIALNLKDLAWTAVPVHLLRDGGQQNQPEYRSKSPLGTVPTLEDGDLAFTQSLAIIEYLDETHPLPRLLPASAEGRARVRAIAQTIACDIHPVNNRRILEALRHRFAADEAAINDWCATWITAGFDGLEALVRAQGSGPFAFGAQPTLADVYLVPQIESARRFKVDIGRWPRLQQIDSACAALEAFSRAAPAVQPDAS